MFKEKMGLNDIDINSTYSEKVKPSKYFGSIVNGDNSTEEEIKERTALGNKAYYANQKTVKKKLVSKKAKLRLYWTIKRTVITHASSEMWVLRGCMRRKLLTGRKILRRIFGPAKDRDGTWRIKEIMN